MKLLIENVLSYDDLPSLPEVAHRILLLAQDSTTNVDVLADAVKADPAISAKILRTANSAFFGRQYAVTSVKAAIPVLGSTLIRTLVLGFSLTQKETWSILEQEYRRFWRRALAQASAAESLARQLTNEDSDSYFVAGLLQDVGILAILRTNPKGYVDEVLNQSTVANLCHVERKQLGFSHVEVSMQFCEKLHLADSTVEAIRDHHGPLDLLNSGTSSKLSQALKLAAHCANLIESDGRTPSREFKTAISRSFGIKDNQIDEFMGEVRARIEQGASAFAVDIGDLPPIHEILGQAKVAIEDIAIRSQLEAAEAKQDAINANDRLERLEVRSRQFEEEMFKDPLTGAFNRRILDTEMQRIIDACHEDQESLSFLFLDIDNFKTLNDVCGHEAGDRALQMVVKVLKSSLRERDLVIRYGGDEFITVFIGVSIDALENIADRICREVLSSLQVLTEQVTATTSVGGIHCPAEFLADLDLASLIPSVDQRMYMAKQQGGNQFVIASIDDPLLVPSDCMNG